MSERSDGAFGNPFWVGIDEFSVPPQDAGFPRGGVVRGSNPSRLVDYGMRRVVGLESRRISGMRNSADLNNPKMSRLPVEFGDWNPLAGDEPSAPEDCSIGCRSASEGKKPAAVIASQFATPLFFGPKAANTVAVPALPTHAKIKLVIKRERQP